MGGLSYTTNRTDLEKAARAALNPQGVAVLLSWFDQTFEKYHVYAVFGIPQPASGAQTWGAEWDRRKRTMGTGRTLPEAVNSVTDQIFGGL